MDIAGKDSMQLIKEIIENKIGNAVAPQQFVDKINSKLNFLDKNNV
jgi:hypothetical protein